MDRRSFLHAVGTIAAAPTVSALAATIAVDFVADNPGASLLHCHMQQHMDYGFKTLIQYS